MNSKWSPAKVYKRKAVAWFTLLIMVFSLWGTFPSARVYAAAAQPAPLLSFPGIGVGEIATVAGTKKATGELGDNGPAKDATIRIPNGGLNFDDAGNLYIPTDNRIRVIPAQDGTLYGIDVKKNYIHTVVGNGTASSSGDGGPAGAATINGTVKTMFDPAGNLYLADKNSVRIIPAQHGPLWGIEHGADLVAGNIYTLAGTGSSTSSNWDDGADLNAVSIQPKDIAMDNAGNLYIINGARIGIIPARDYGAEEALYGIATAMEANKLYTVAGTSTGYSGDGGPATAAQLKTPNALAFDGAGNMYISDSGNRRIRKVDPQGIITTIAGKETNGDPTPGPAEDSKIPGTHWLGFHAGTLYLCGSGYIYTIDSSGQLAIVADKNTPTAPANDSLKSSVFTAHGLAWDDRGNLYIADGNSRILYMRLDPTPELKTLTISGAPALNYSGIPVTYDLNDLTIAGVGEDDQPFDVTGLDAEWSITNTANAYISDHTLTVSNAGDIEVQVSVNNVTSNKLTLPVTGVAVTPLQITSTVTDRIGKNIVLEFDGPVEDVSGLAAQFRAKVNGVEAAIAAVNLGDTPNQIILTLSQWNALANTMSTPQDVTLSYTIGGQEQVRSTDGRVLENFIDQPVDNKLVQISNGVVDFAPVANEITYDSAAMTMKYRFVEPVDYDDVHLILYLTNGFFRSFDKNLNGTGADGSGKVKLLEKDTLKEVELPNIGTVVHSGGTGWLEMTDWYFEQIGGHSPLGLKLQSLALKPSTTYVIEIAKGFEFNNGSLTDIAYIFEFTTAAESLTKPYWNAGAALSYDLGTMQAGAASVQPFGLMPVTTGSALSYDPAPVTTGSALSFGLMAATPGAALTLSWPEAQDNHGTAYNNLRYNIYQNGLLLATVGGTETTYEVSGLSPGTSYYFSVEAEDFAGNKSEVNLHATVTTPPDGTQQPAPGLTPDSGDKLPGQAVDIRFTDNAAWRQAVTHVLLDGVSLTSAQYTLSPGILHIREGVIDSSGSHSIVIKATGYVDTSVTQLTAGSGTGTPGGGADILPPTWPVGASLTGDKDKQVNANLKWTAARDNVGVTEYRIYLAGEDTPIKVVAGTVTSAYITDIGSGQVTVLVKAVDAAGNESTALSCIVGGQNVGSFTVTIAALNTDPNNAVIQFDFTAGFMSPDNIANRLSDAHYLANLSQIKLYKKDTTTPIAYATENYHHYGDSGVSADKRLRRLTLTYRGLEKDAVYVVEAGAGITANNGSTLGMDYTYEFTAGGTPAVVPNNPPANQGTATNAPDNSEANKKILENLAKVTEEQRQAARLTEGHAEAGIGETSQQTLQTNDGVRLVIPPGALQGLAGLEQGTGPVRFKVEIGSVTEVPKAESASLMLDPVKFQREFSIEGIDEGEAQFDVPITVSFPVTSADLPGGTQFEQLAIYWWNPDKKDWVKLGGVYDAAAGTISITTYHFSTYAVMADPVDRPLRLAGSTRFDTANQVADYGWRGGADQAVLVNAYAYADALAAVPLAYKLNAPILFTEKDRVTPETLAQLQRLGVQKVVLAGGTGVISEAAEAELAGLYGEANVTRYGGQERYETAALLAEALGSTGQAIIVNTEQGRYTDTLAISGYAGYYGVPILFTRSDGLPAATAKALDDGKVSRTIVVGGTGVIPQTLADRLPEATRYGGKNAYETSVLVAEGLGLSTSQVYVVTALNFADALVAGNLSARTLSPIILVDKEIPRPTADFLLNHKGKITNLIMVGGEGAVSSIQESAMRSAILAGTGSGAGDGTGDGSGANSRPAEMFDDFVPEATVLKDSEDRIEYRYNNLIPYNRVELVWYFSFGFFSTFESNLQNYVKFYEKETKTVVDLPNVVTIPITSEGHMEITDWWFDRIGGHAPLGLTLKSRELKPDTTYVIEILAGFTFNNGNKTSKTYSFEFTTTRN
ncbi:putative cell wall-binding protein [Desulfitobacterium sp. LBE]|nr:MULTISPECIES: cell wall-binding repeat-containing protein [Desulfitobacterium]TWH57409.1 putative cell wall-binding protein [Desulfitobacterium sp. LBE]